MADKTHPAYYRLAHSWCAGDRTPVELYVKEGRKTVLWGWACPDCNAAAAAPAPKHEVA